MHIDFRPAAGYFQFKRLREIDQIFFGNKEDVSAAVPRRAIQRLNILSSVTMMIREKSCGDALDTFMVQQIHQLFWISEPAKDKGVPAGRLVERDGFSRARIDKALQVRGAEE